MNKIPNLSLTRYVYLTRLKTVRSKEDETFLSIQMIGNSGTHFYYKQQRYNNRLQFSIEQ